MKAEGDIKPPKLIKKVNPIYPEEARKQGISGVVLLSTRSNEQGNIVGVKIVKRPP